MKDRKIKDILKELENLDLTLLNYLVELIKNKDNLKNLEVEELENIFTTIKHLNINNTDLFLNLNTLLEDLEFLENDIFKKEKKVSFRISYLDYLKLKNKANEEEISISSYIRKCLKNCI
jgi:predicted DNA binding CopG/RHH family protein